LAIVSNLVARQALPVHKTSDINKIELFLYQCTLQLLLFQYKCNTEDFIGERALSVLNIVCVPVACNCVLKCLCNVISSWICYAQRDVWLNALCENQYTTITCSSLPCLDFIYHLDIISHLYVIDRYRYIAVCLGIVPWVFYKKKRITYIAINIYIVDYEYYICCDIYTFKPVLKSYRSHYIYDRFSVLIVYRNTLYD